ncbi:MAG: 30S ribosomal protein S18 [Candidatus Cloacimonetes bacterium]|nr:30S ribosomal protein S18 [Candidatus Cloacimonadota bacterium]
MTEEKIEKNNEIENREEQEDFKRSQPDKRKAGKTFRGKPSRDMRQGGKNKFFFRKKVCFFCKNRDVSIDYKDVNLMRRFISESGKISPRRFTGTCAKHQRRLVVEIKKARQMALISYTEKLYQ